VTVHHLRAAHHAMRRAAARGARQRIAGWRRHWLGTSSLGLPGSLAVAESFIPWTH
jgi:hypothetical protein